VQTVVEEATRVTNTLVPPELLYLLIAYFDPQKIILIGSVARGDTGSDRNSISSSCSTTMSRLRC
jgi:hypothetical protein